MDPGRMSQRRLLLLPLLLLLLLSIGSVMSRALSSDDWQRLAGTGADVLSDAILPCVESGSCRGREFGSMSEDVSKFGNVPPCRFHGWVRCIQYPGPSIRDAAHDQYAPTPKYSHHQQNKDSLPQQRPYPAPPSNAHQQSPQEYGPYPSKAVGQGRVSEPSGFVSANTQRSFGHQHQQQEQHSLWQPKEREMQEREMQEREMQEQRSALAQPAVEIPKRAEWQGKMGAAVQFQQHPDAAVLLSSVNKQSAERWGNQPGAQRSRPESRGLTQPIQRPVEFQHPHQRIEQSSQQLSRPSKFTQKQQQLIQNEFLGNNFVEAPPFSQQSPNRQQQPGQFRQLTQPGQETFKTSSFVHDPDMSGQQFAAETQPPRPFVKVSALPVESQRPTGASSERDKSFQQAPPRLGPIQPHSNPSFRPVEAAQQITDPRRFIEPPPQRVAFEPQQQRFVQVNQPVTDPIKKEEPKQFASQTNREPTQRLPQANRPVVKLPQPPRPLDSQQPIIPENPFRNKQQLQVQAEPLQQRPMEPQRLQPLTTQRSAEPPPPPLVKSNSLGESPQFIEPAKPSLENLFQFDSSTDTQLAREQLTELIRLLAQSASQQTDPNRDAFGGLTTPNQSASDRRGESNIVPFIAFSEPLPLEPTSSNSLF